MKIAKGDKITVYNENQDKAPALVEVLAVTPVPGKTVGVLFDNEVPSGHSCDGRGPNGRCRWYAADHVLTPAKAAEIQAALDARALADAIAEKDFVLEIGDNGVVIEEVLDAEAFDEE